jgi:hypothetical protein
MRTGPVSCSRTGRQMPPGFQAGSSQGAAWKAPVRARRGAAGWAGQVTSTASACSDRARRASVTSKVWGTK